MDRKLLCIRRLWRSWGETTRLCLIGDSGSIHLRRWAEHFSKSNEILVISDTPEPIPNIRVEQIFVMKAGVKNLLKVRQMRRLVREFRPDVVHGHYLTVGGLYAALSGGRKIVGSAWGSDIYYGPRRSFTERLILRYVLRKCDFVFAGTKDMADRVRSSGFKGGLALFRFGVDPSVFRKTSPHGTGEFRILSIRPCSKIYNPLVIIEAFSTLMVQMPRAYLYLFDFGNLVDEVHRTVNSDPQLKERVRFLQRQSHAQMVGVYNSADIAVSVPDSDSAAASVLESLACELPVIASDIPAMRECIDDSVNGYLTAIDSSALADKIRKSYSVRAMLAPMGRRAREKILDEKNQLTFESNLRVAEAAYEKVLSSP
jgi:glycosyltransferase involved in cell wall biosynthesis